MAAAQASLRSGNISLSLLNVSDRESYRFYIDIAVGGSGVVCPSSETAASKKRYDTGRLTALPAMSVGKGPVLSDCGWTTHCVSMELDDPRLILQLLSWT